LRDHLDDFIARCGDDQRARPRFVERQLRAITTCGDIGYGFVRLECTRCRDPRVVPFSCKVRLCPSCSGRRMSEQAAHLVDRVLPHVPYRQWIFTLPGELARVVAVDADLATAAFGVFANKLARWRRERAHDVASWHPKPAACSRFSASQTARRNHPATRPDQHAPPPGQHQEEGRPDRSSPGADRRAPLSRSFFG